MTLYVDSNVVRFALREVSELHDRAVSDGDHPERIRALRDAVDVITRARSAVNRQLRDRYTATEAGAAKEKQRTSQGRIRRNNKTIDTATKRKHLWTDKEIAVIERTELTNMECADLLGRTLRGVARKRESLGIRVGRSGSSSTAKEVSFDA